MLTDYVQLIYALEQQGLYKEASLFDDKLVKLAQETGIKVFADLLEKEMWEHYPHYNVGNVPEYAKYFWIMPSGEILLLDDPHIAECHKILDVMFKKYNPSQMVKNLIQEMGLFRFIYRATGAVRAWIHKNGVMQINSVMPMTRNQREAVGAFKSRQYSRSKPASPSFWQERRQNLVTAQNDDFTKALMSELLLNTEPFHNDHDWKKNEHLWLLSNGQILSTGGIGHHSFIKLLIQKMKSDGLYDVPEDVQEKLSRYGPERLMAHYIGAVRIYVPSGLNKIYITSAIRPTNDQIRAIQELRQETGFKVNIEQISYTPLVYNQGAVKAFNSTENWSKFVDKNEQMPSRPTPSRELLFNDDDDDVYSVSKARDARNVEQYQNPKLKELYTKSAQTETQLEADTEQNLFPESINTLEDFQKAYLTKFEVLPPGEVPNLPHKNGYSMWVTPDGSIINLGKIHHGSSISHISDAYHLTDHFRNYYYNDRNSVYNNTYRAMAKHFHYIRIYLESDGELYINDYITPTVEQTKAIRALINNNADVINDIRVTKGAFDKSYSHEMELPIEKWEQTTRRPEDDPSQQPVVPKVKPPVENLNGFTSNDYSNLTKRLDRQRIMEQYENPKLRELYLKSAKQKPRRFKSGM